MGSLLCLPKPPGDVLFRLGILGLEEHLTAHAVLDEFALQEESGPIGHARGLLDAVRM